MPIRIEQTKRTLVLAFALLLTTSCSMVARDAVEASESSRSEITATKPDRKGTCDEPLRVLLFPYIPQCQTGDAFVHMQTRMEREFRQQTGHCLSVTIADPQFALYEPETLASYLRGPDAPFDVVEIDTVILGELVDLGVLRSWSEVEVSRYFPTAIAASQVAGRPYGIPHLMCSEFVISRNKDILSAGSAAALAAALAAVPTRNRRLSGDAAGSWTLPGLYLDAWNDTFPEQPVQISKSAEKSVVASLGSVLAHCGGNPNRCLENGGIYDDTTKAAEELGKGETAAMFSYSEQLHYVLRSATDPSAISMVPAPLGEGQSVLTYTDALVLRNGCNSDCEQQALKFADYLNSQATMKWYLLAEECPGEVPPRYLIPATQDAFDIPAIAKDRHYQSIRAALDGATMMPTSGLAGARKALRDDILQKLREHNRAN